MRGEHCTARRARRIKWGSSPHARGTPVDGGPVDLDEGIIPACAGNTKTSDCVKLLSRDHPRMRGEHRSVHRDDSPSRGSSPHARGTHLDGRQLCHPDGIIPACAGNTKETECQTCERGDHPRMRGEHSVSMNSFIWGRGSSPHARGTLAVVPAARLVHGIIPACAGNTHAGPRRYVESDWDLSL